MKFAVLGMGKTGHSVTCYLLNEGFEVCCWDRNPEKLREIQKHGITITGVLEGHFHPDVNQNIAKAVSESSHILINTLAMGHRDIATMLKGILRHGQRILIFNCNWGILEFHQILGQEIRQKGITLMETGGMHLMTDLVTVGACHLKKIKKTLHVACYPRENLHDVLEELRPAFPQFVPVENTLMTSLNATNPILHAPIALCGFSKIEGGVDHFFYKEGATPSVVSYIEKIDHERLAVMDAIGVTGDSCLEIVNQAWGTSCEHLYDAIHVNYPASKGPTSIHYRFITEDIPYGICPIAKLGKLYEVPTPFTDSLIDIYSKLMGEDYLKQCSDFTKAEIETLCFK